MTSHYVAPPALSHVASSSISVAYQHHGKYIKSSPTAQFFSLWPFNHCQSYPQQSWAWIVGNGYFPPCSLRQYLYVPEPHTMSKPSITVTNRDLQSPGSLSVEKEIEFDLEKPAKLYCLSTCACWLQGIKYWYPFIRFGTTALIINDSSRWKQCRVSPRPMARPWWNIEVFTSMHNFKMIFHGLQCLALTGNADHSQEGVDKGFVCERGV